MAMVEGEGSIGRTTDVQPWDIIRHDLIGEFDSSPDVFNSVLQYSQSYLAGGNQPQNGREYFERLENNMLPTDMLDFLIVVMEQLQLHVDLGTVSVPGVLRQFKENLQVYRKAEMEDEQSDRNFVGRKKYIDEIRNLFEGDNRIFKGVCICGMGGLGKTTLASHICRLLKPRWKIITVDLREVTLLKDLLREIFIKLGCPGFIQESEGDILDQIIQFLLEKDRIKQRSILMLDNIEDIINNEGTDRFKEGFLSKFSELLQEDDDYKMRLLLTSRVKLSKLVKGRTGNRSLPSRQDSGIGVILEKELSPMEPSDAHELFRRSICGKKVESSKIEKILKLCGYSPLAITTLCGSIRYGLLNPYTIIENLKPESRFGSIEETAAVTQCLEKTFDLLGDKEKQYLVRLSVFHTASFDLEAAATVLGETSLRGEQTSLKLFNLRSRHLLESTEASYSDHPGRVETRFSLHPLVFHLLKSKAQSQPFLQAMKIAKYKFVQHFRRVVCKIAEEMEINCLQGQRKLGIDRVHVSNFYEILAGPDASETTDNFQTIVESRRISEISDELLYDDTRWGLVKNFTAKTKGKETSQLEYIFWRVYQATMVMDMDRNQEAKTILEDADVLLHKVRGEEFAMAAVIGSFFYAKGRLFLREYQCEESIECLKQASHMFRIRGMKKDYHAYLAKIFNALGVAHLRQSEANLEKAREYHQRALKLITKCSQKWFNVEVPGYIQNLGTCLFKEGQVLSKSGKTEEAKSKYQEAIQYYDNGIKLSFQMNLHKQDGHAQILQNRGEAHAALENFEKAEKDVEDAMMLRRKLMSPPHLQLTLVTFKMAKVRYQKAVCLFHRNNRVTAINTMFEAKTRCDEVVDFITWGGLPITHRLYPEVKELIFKVLVSLQEWKQLQKLLKKIQKFEDGVYQKDIDRRRSIKTTTKPRLTQNELYALINSRGATLMPANAGSDDSDIELPESSSSSDDDSDEYNPLKQQKQYMLVKDKIPSDLFDEKQRVVDFTSILDGSYFKNTQPMENMPDSGMSVDVPDVDLSTRMEVDEEDDTEDVESSLSNKNVCYEDLVTHEHQTEPNEENMERKTHNPPIRRQSSSQEMDVFGKLELLPRKSIEMPEDMKILQDNLLDNGAERRRAWQGSSMESASLEYSMDKEGIISATEQLQKVELSVKKRNLLKMGEAETILEEDSDTEDNVPVVENTKEIEQTRERRRRKARISRQTSVSDDTPVLHAKRQFQEGN